MNDSKALITHQHHRHAKRSAPTSSAQPSQPTHFFVGRPHNPPYAWSYDDEMRASNILWLTEEVVDGKKLDIVYSEEIVSMSVGMVSRKAGKRNARKRKIEDDEIIDLTGSDEDDAPGKREPTTPIKLSRQRSRPGLIVSAGFDYRKRTRPNPITSSPLARYSSTPSSLALESSPISQSTSSKLTTPHSDSPHNRSIAGARTSSDYPFEESRSKRAELRAVFVSSSYEV